MRKLKDVKLYTDGSCIGNPGPGGWAYILVYKDKEGTGSGGAPHTTNNKMEITAVIAGIKRLKQPCNLTVYSDSKYVVNAFSEHWVDNWQRNGWRTSTGNSVKNIDEWKVLLNLMKPHVVHFKWVKGHASNPYNNRCDGMAVLESKKYS